MVFAGRVEQDFIDPELVAELEPKVGRACLDAIVAFPIAEEVRLSTRSRECVADRSAGFASRGGLGLGSVDQEEPLSEVGRA